MSEQQQNGYLIFGATGSVGAVLSKRLVDDGFHVMLVGRDESKLSAAAEQLGMPYSVCDVGDPDTFKTAFKNAAERFDVVGTVNCIGSVMLKPAHLLSDDEWFETMRINLDSSFYMLREAARAMRKQGGSIVLMSSSAACHGMPNHEAIAAAKGGVSGLTISAAASYAARDIRVNAVAPGLVKSNMTRHLWENEATAQTSIDMHPLMRLGEPEKIASLVHWLLLPENDWITGQVIGVDGGLAGVMGRQKVKAG